MYQNVKDDMKQALSNSCYTSFPSVCRILKDGKIKFFYVREICSVLYWKMHE